MSDSLENQTEENIKLNFDTLVLSERMTKNQGRKRVYKYPTSPTPHRTSTHHGSHEAALCSQESL